MKNIGLILLFFWQVGFGQGFAPIGAKWIYEVDPCGVVYTDTVVSQKDTVFQNRTFRKLKHQKSNISYLFMISSSGVYLYDNDTLRKTFPFGLSLNQINYVDIKFGYQNSISGVISYNYKSIRTTCTGLAKTVLNQDTITIYTLDIEPNTVSGQNYMYNQITYNNLSGRLNTAVLYNPINLVYATCGYSILKKFYTNKYEFSNNTWKFVTTNFDEISIDVPLNIYPNPFSDVLFFENNSIINKICFYKIYNYLGENVKSGNVLYNSVLNCSELNSGLYQLVLYNNEKIILSKKLIKK